MVDQNIGDDFGIDLRALLRQGQKGKDHDDALLFVLQTVLQGKMQKSKRLSGPGRRRQCVKPFRLLAHFSALLKYPVPICIQGPVRRG